MGRGRRHGRVGAAVSKLRVLDLFSGIGGFSLGLERTGGFETVAFCEIEPFPRKVLAKHWPEVPCYHDVRTLTAEILARDGIAVDVITGGFPCQDLSSAGKRAGIGSETRSGLYAEVLRLARDLRPKFIILENVAGLLSGPSEKRGGWFGRVLGDLAECGYDAEWENIPASALGAPHRRERVWLMAYTKKDNDAKFQGIYSGQQNRFFGDYVGSFTWWKAEPKLGRVADGVPDRVDRLAALGNSVVPQIPEMIGHAILSAEAGQ